ncbi:MAG: hydratase [Pseudomonadota bacterium]
MFIGSVFSPYYAWSGRDDPENHVCVNVALYGSPARWAMTERGRRRVQRTQDAFFVGASGIERDGDGLRISINERCAPLPLRVQGEVLIRPHAISSLAYPIDRASEHFWRPICPSCTIDVRLTQPSLSWRGTGYMDMNWGHRPLERTFSHWDWMRVDRGAGRSAIFYETEELGAPGRKLALSVEADGSASPTKAPERHPLPSTLWRIGRSAWSDGEPAKMIRTLEDAPFYARTELEVGLRGKRHTAIHESLSLRRFSNLAVQCLLPFRMPRRA